VSDPPPDWVKVNREHWDERVPIHVASAFYDVESFIAGKPAVEPFEVEELGPLGELRLVHLQCHFGLDMLDLVRLHPGLTAVGLDYSAPALDAARSLAARVELSSRCSFVQSNVMDASATLGTSEFDVVYTGKGAICWLNDLDRWAAECFALLRPGGFLYLSEFHPVGYALSTSEPTVGDDYFRTDPWVDEAEGSYADLNAATNNNICVAWNHPLPAIFKALLSAGFELRFFHEFDYTVFKLNDWLIKGDDGRWRWPSPERRLPLMYSLKAFKPT
jgi:SAM-dependent methyltransferase